MPSPTTEANWDGWIYHTQVNVFAQAAGILEDAAMQRIEIDSKAQRKLKSEDSLFAIIEVTKVGTATIQWNFNSRVLFKLP